MNICNHCQNETPALINVKFEISDNKDIHIKFYDFILSQSEIISATIPHKLFKGGIKFMQGVDSFNICNECIGGLFQALGESLDEWVMSHKNLLKDHETLLSNRTVH